MADHRLRATRENLHGHFSNALSPVLEIEPGDTVSFECLDAGWGLEPHDGIQFARRTFPDRDTELDAGHALTGPIAIRGAKPGQVLKVEIEEITLGEWGTTYIGGWKCDWNDQLGISEGGAFHVWSFDTADATATNQHGHTVKTRPFMGIYGNAPSADGVHSTVPPRRVGGNIDCKELGAGTTLYLPIEVEGALFSTGDGHAAQGDGEICVTAIEAPMQSARLKFDLIDGLNLTFPIAKTPSAWIALAFHTDLDEAVRLALESIVSLMTREYNLSRLDAIGLASVTVDFRVTQVVNEAKGVHAVLPLDAIKRV